MNDINQDITRMIVEMRELGKLPAPCKGGSHNKDVYKRQVEGDRHFFRTQSNGMDISKSPEEMFDLEIENDLKFVDQRIREYWGLSTVPADGKRGSSEPETI